MFGISINSLDSNTFLLNLNEGPRYFDIRMFLFHQSYGVIDYTHDINLVKCTDEHWKIMPGMADKSELYGY